MKLIYSPTSPFSRKILLLISMLGLENKIETIKVNSLQNTEEVRRYNPLGKVPVLLLENGETIFDSPVIAEYLLSSNQKDIDLSQKRLQALADGIMDAAFALVMENRRPKEQQSDFWKERWEAAINNGVTEFEMQYLKEVNNWNLGAISMACALDYIAFRLPEINWQQKKSKANIWYQSIVDQPTMKLTDPRQ